MLNLCEIVSKASKQKIRELTWVCCYEVCGVSELISVFAGEQAVTVSM